MYVPNAGRTRIAYRRTRRVRTCVGDRVGLSGRPTGRPDMPRSVARRAERTGPYLENCRMSLPSGIITFLFTDVEGSTKLWEKYPVAMRAVLARHDALLHTILKQHGGHVFKTVGDSFYAAFSVATDAVNAAIATQIALLQEDWT